MLMLAAMLENPDDEPLFEKFYDKYNKLVYYIAKDNLGNHYLAEECVQNVFVCFAKNFHNIKDSFNDNSSRVESLVKIIAKNASVDIYRKNKKHTANVVDADISDFFSLSYEEFDYCEKMLLKEAIDALPEKIKIVFYLKYVCNYSGAEIAAMLNITESLVRKRCLQGRERARRYIERENRKE